MDILKLFSLCRLNCLSYVLWSPPRQGPSLGGLCSVTSAFSLFLAPTTSFRLAWAVLLPDEGRGCVEGAWDQGWFQASWQRGVCLFLTYFVMWPNRGLSLVLSSCTKHLRMPSTTPPLAVFFPGLPICTRSVQQTFTSTLKALSKAGV